MASLKAEVESLLAAAADREIDHAEATKMASEAHQAQVDDLVETARRLAAAHSRQDARQAEERAELVANFERALESRDLLGQAKGVLMVGMRCTAEKAFATMVAQSQHENRKVVDVAAEVIARALRRAQA